MLVRVAIVGGGPAGYEAALVAAQLGADVTVVDRDGLGGACVLTDCVPSKTLIATSELMESLASASSLGIRFRGAEGNASWNDDNVATSPPDVVSVDSPTVNARVKSLAMAQSMDVARRLSREGIKVVQGAGRFVDGRRVAVHRAHDDEAEEPDTVVEADVFLIATGAHPRIVPGAEPDGERILTWRDVYDAMGSQVTLISSRDRVLPGEDVDAAELIETVFARRGIKIVKNARADGVQRTAAGVRVLLQGGGEIEGSHALMTVGSIPTTQGLRLEDVGVALDDRGFIKVDKVSRTTAAGIYAAGDCTGVLMLASVAAMQGRIAMWHALGEAVAPLRLATVSATVFTDPEIATVGVSQNDVESGAVMAETIKLPLSTNARAKMQNITDGFVKLFCRPGSKTILGGVVVAPRASELVLAVSLAVQHGLTADQLAHTFSIYPSLGGSVTEAARQLMRR
jgi:dihydrolipoamide dehydrogenase